MANLTQTVPSLATLLEQSRSNAECAVAGLDESTCSICPSPDSWSITGVFEHLAVIEKRIPAMLRKRLFTEGVPTSYQADDSENLAMIASIESRSNSVSAPVAVCPEGRYASCHDALSAFQVERNETIAYVQDPRGDLRTLSLPHPIFGMLSGYQWVIALAAHTNRHVKQIEEIKRCLFNKAVPQSNRAVP